MILNLPNLLTISRILFLPLFVGGFYLADPAARWVTFVVFALAGITDFFDGYIARARRQVSSFGRFLDPVADKLLIVSAIVMLTAFDRIAGLVVLPALVILCREILVSGLREFLAEVQIGVPVSRLAKWKTGIQMVAIACLLLGDAVPGLPLETAGVVGIWGAAALTLLTGYDYFRSGLVHVLKAPPGEKPDADSSRGSSTTT
ncbi:MAG: CDP-diacylglycerol--glycerol-3-phosphate 3-phosphatidyltransferase [Pseudomonadota bacterium]